MRIVDELIGFCFKHGCTNIDINVNFDDKNLSVITINCTIIDLSKEHLERFLKVLSLDRQEEMEECYWMLTGDDSFGDELTLTASMIDKCDVYYNDNKMKIIAYRKEK